MEKGKIDLYLVSLDHYYPGRGNASAIREEYDIHIL